MMKILAVSASFLMLSHEAYAAPRYYTSWVFRATYESGETFESSNTADAESVVPWIGASWKCTKDPISYSKQKTFTGGFTCVSGQSFMSVMAACSPTKVNTDANLASVGDGRGYIMLSVVCSTVLTNPAPAKSEGQSL